MLGGPGDEFATLPDDPALLEKPEPKVSSIGDMFDAGRMGTRAEGLTVSNGLYARARMRSVIEALTERGYMTQGDIRYGKGRPRPFMNPYEAGPIAEGGNNLSWAGRETGAIWGAVRDEQQKDPGFLKGMGTAEEFDAANDRQQKSDVALAGDIRSRGQGVLGELAFFAGGLAESLAKDPVSLVMGPAGGVTGSVARQIGVTAAREAAYGALYTAAAQPILQANADARGAARDLGDAASDIAIGAVTGGLIGGALKGVELGAPRAGELAAGAREAVLAQAYPRLPEPLRPKMRMRGTELDRAVITALRDQPDLTPDDRASLAVLEADVMERESSPFLPGEAGDAAHVEAMEAILRALDSDAPAPAKADLRSSTAYVGGRTAPAMPAAGRVSSRFGMRRHPISGQMRQHSGTDIAAPLNSPVQAMADGEVVFVGTAGGYGNQVRVRHPNGLVTSYSHLNGFDVAVGDAVRAGERIARVGSTGRSTGPHLHYEVRRDGVAIDPDTADFAAARPERGEAVAEAGAAPDAAAIADAGTSEAWADVVARMRAAEAGEAPAALFHPSVGDIDVPWGMAGTGKSDGFGLAKIIAFHPEVIDDLPSLLLDMAEVSRSSNRVRLASASHEAAVRLDWDGERKTWLMTAYETSDRRGKSPAMADDERAIAGGRDGSPGLGEVADIGDVALKDNEMAGSWIAPPTARFDVRQFPVEYDRVAADMEPGTVLLAHLGDFYEVVGQHAPKVARALDVALTTRDGRSMVGVPAWSLERYLRDLDAAGIRYALAETDGKRYRLGTAPSPATAADSATLARFDTPGGEGQRIVADGLEHDARMDVEAGADGSFRLSDEGDEVSISDVLAQADSEEAGLAAMRACIVPAKPVAGGGGDGA